MRKVLAIAQKDYVETVRTRMFLLTVLVPTAIMVLAVVFAGREMREERERAAARGEGAPAGLEVDRPLDAAGVEPGAEADGPEQSGRLVAAFAAMFLMFMGIVTSAGHLVSSVVEEKSSRVIEVLLSAVSPLELMAGKIIGLAGVGVTFVALFAASMLVAAASQGFVPSVEPAVVACFIVYYLLGYVLVASLFAAAGSACNTMKETQAIMFPLTFIFVLPMATWHVIAGNPEGWLARALSAFPPTTAMVMTVRIAIMPEVPVLDVALSFVVLAASVPLAVWACARIFRTGVLMYGKPPKLRDLLRWAREA
jgi:ABC-2 type transport system permease protein